MATYFGGLNPIRVSAAVLATTASIASGATANLYTAPSNGYAELTAVFRASTTTGTVQLLAGGSLISEVDLTVNANGLSPMGIGHTASNSAGSSLTAAANQYYNFGRFVLGPSQTAAINNQSGGPIVYAAIQGVAFING